MQKNLDHRSWPDSLAGNGGANEGRVSHLKLPRRPRYKEFSASASSRLVAAITLSPNLPNHYLAETLAQTLRNETGETVLLVKLISAADVSNKTGALSVKSILGNESGAQMALPQNNGTIAKITLQVNDRADALEPTTALLRHLSSHYDCVIVQGDLSATPLWALLEFSSLADSIYLFLRPQAQELHRYDSFATDLRTLAPGDFLDLHSVLCLSGSEHASETAEFCNAHPHVFIHDCPARDFNGMDASVPTGWFLKDVRRLAREIGHCRLGLALSAGGAKGLAHIGVIQILEENGIEVDVIAGCSMGAYIAATWAIGCEGGQMEKLARENEKLRGFWRLIDPTILPRQGFVHGNAVRRRLQQTVGDAHFSDLVRPIRVVATNLDTLDREVFASGSVAEAVQASCAIPGVVVPVSIGNETYIDGGVSDPLPVDVLHEMKVDRIIAVNAIPPSSFLKCCREVERDQAELSKKRFSLFKNINQQINYFARGNILDIMMRAVHGGQIRMAERASSQADLVLRPLAIDAHWHDFNHPGKYIALGRKVALEHLDELKALVQPKTSHEHKLSHHEMAAFI